MCHAMLRFWSKKNSPPNKFSPLLPFCFWLFLDVSCTSDCRLCTELVKQGETQCLAFLLQSLMGFFVFLFWHSWKVPLFFQKTREISPAYRKVAPGWCEKLISCARVYHNPVESIVSIANSFLGGNKFATLRTIPAIILSAPMKNSLFTFPLCT